MILTALRAAAHGRPLQVAVLVLAVKALLLLFGMVSYQTLTDNPLGSLREAFAIWERWDALHYLSLAKDGYAAEGERRVLLAFYPLFPWLVRLAARLTGDFLAAGVLVAGLASVAAGVCLYLLAAEDAAPDEAQRAVWFLLIFPSAYVLHIPYSEGLFLALALGAFVAARRRRWLVAGLLGGLAALTRVNAVWLVPALAMEAYRDRRVVGWRGPLAAATLVGAGLAAHLALNWSVAGDPFAFLALHRDHWYRRLDWPWAGPLEAWRALNRKSPAEAMMVGWQELLFALLGLAGSIAAWCTQRTSYAVWMTGNWLMFVSQPFMYGVPRLSLVLFPLFLLFARLSRRPLWAALLTAPSLLLLALFASLFTQGYWVF